MGLELQLIPVQNWPQGEPDSATARLCSQTGYNDDRVKHPAGQRERWTRWRFEYLEWDPEGSPVSIHMHPGVVDGIAHDVAGSSGRRKWADCCSDGWKPVRGLPFGSSDTSESPVSIASAADSFWTAREIAALEEAAANILAAGELAVVGLYRSHTRPGFQLEEPDFDLIRRYFSDPSDLILLIKPKGEGGISGAIPCLGRGTTARVR